MDAERQPLLGCAGSRYGIRFRPLTSEEVLQVRQDMAWRRTRYCLVFMFWALMAMFLSIITCILITAPKCDTPEMSLDNVPAVPPVHMSFVPLIARLNGEKVYAL